MIQPLTALASTTLCACACLIPHSVAIAPPEEPRASREQPIGLRPGHVRVTRETWLSPRDADLVPLESAGPGLTVDFIADLPAGTKVADVVAVQRLSAVDSSGRDLVESRPEKDPDPARAALQSVSANVRTRSLRLGLGAPTASAASVFTSIQATIRTYTGVSKVPLEDNAQWTPVQLGDLRAEYRLRTVGTLHYVSFRPASAGEHVYRVEPRWTSSGLPTSPSLKDSGELSYLIDRELMATKGLSVTIITGVSVKDVEAAGVCVPLPQ